MSSQAASPNVSARALQRRARRGQVGSDRPADAVQDQLEPDDRGQRHEHGAGLELITQVLCYRHRQPGLADAARPAQRHQPHLGAGDQADYLIDVLLPPDQRRRAYRQRARAPGTRPRRHRGCGRDAGGGEPLAQ
jgi:hypothetical protein